jgi:putative flippase GtrA
MALTDTREGRYLARWITDHGFDTHLPPIVPRLLGLAAQLNRYTIVSALSLALDFAVYLALTNAGYRAMLAGIAGYAVGMLLHFSLSTRYVFRRRASGKSDARLFSEFMVSGLAGILITAVVITVATEAFGLSPLLAKVCAVAVSFIAVFLLRRAVVFASLERRRKPRD